MVFRQAPLTLAAAQVLRKLMKIALQHMPLLVELTSMSSGFRIEL